jgi:predicted RecA/RadA family phage recombinase
MKTYSESGERISVVVAAGCAVGDPLIIGDINCVAETLAAAGGTATVRTQGVFWLSVKGVDDAGNKSIAVGEQIFFVAADTPKLSRKCAGIFFGWALDAVNASETKTIRVYLGGAGVGVLDLPFTSGPATTTPWVAHDYAGAHADWILSREAVLAVGTITLTSLPVLEEKFVVGSQQFHFRTLRKVKGEVTLGATAAACCTNIIAALTLDIPSEVTATQGAGTTVVVTAVDPGVVGNAIVFTEACTTFAMDGSGLLGGTTAGVDRVENVYTLLRCTNSDQAANIVALPTQGKAYWVYNGTSWAIVIKGSGQTGITVATTKRAIVMGNGTDFERWTADA